MVEKTESIIFLKKIAPSEPYLKKYYTQDMRTRVKRISINFAEGQDGTLKVKVYAINGYGTPTPLINMVGDEWLSGNDLMRIINLDVSLNNNSYIVVEADNQGDYDYTVDVTVELENVEAVKS